MKTAVVTDTNSGITGEEAAARGIYLIPMPVIIDGESYFEGQSITEEQFYAALTGDRKVSTSMPSPGDVMELWDKALSEHEELIYIPMSSGLSHSCSVAQGLAEDYDGRVQVADNHRISVTMRESVFMAADLADQGRSAKEIQEALEQDAYNSSIYISVDTLVYLKRGGRITPTAAMLGSVLNIKPILTIQGERLDSFAKARSMKKCREKMIDAIRNDYEKRFADEDPAKLRIGAAGAGLTKEEAEIWRSAVAEAFPQADVYYNPLSVSIGCHVGPGAYGIGISFR